MTTSTTPLRWVREDDPRWDADKERVFAPIPAQVFPALSRNPGERLSSDWWHVERNGQVIAYGWLDDVWGDAEILLAVEEGARGGGAGRFVLDHVEEEAAARGLHYVVNVVRDGHPDRGAVQEWFLAHGFRGTDDGRLRKKVGGTVAAEAGGTGNEERQARYAVERERAVARPRSGDAPAGGDLGPGAEESGGYVDPEHHRY